MTNANNNIAIDKHLARLSFNRAAASYDDVAVLQREVGTRLIERLDVIKIKPKWILDVGCGTGDITMQLGSLYDSANVIALDFADNMLAAARHKLPWLNRWVKQQYKHLCADAEKLPLQDNCVDFIFSNLSLQWCNDLPNTFREFYRVLKPGGLLLFSSFGPDTLKELRESWLHADASQHVHTFIDMHHVGDALLQSNYSDPVMDMEYFTLTYKDTTQLMKELKNLGAHNASNNRPRGLTSRAKLNAMKQHYEQYRQAGTLPATYEVVYGHAWIGDSKKTATDDSVVVNFSKPNK